MKKVFLDCGSYDGCSIRKFCDLHDKKSEYEFHCFEGNPLLATYHPVNDRCVFHNTIVLNTEEETEFYVHAKTGGSSISEKKTKRYIRKSKNKFGDHNVIKLKPIRLSNYIKSNFQSKDEIILKLDIEGSEYLVLQDLIDTRTIDYIDKIFIEWHGEGRTEYKNPKKFIRKFQILCKEKKIKLDKNWDSMHPPYLKEKENDEYSHHRRRK